MSYSPPVENATTHPGGSHAPLSRLRLDPAPGGLALVQALLNTKAIRGKADDLLGERQTAQEWLDAALAQWSARAGLAAPRIRVTEPLRVQLIALRARVRAAVSAQFEPPAAARFSAARFSAAITTDGQLRVAPTGIGATWIESAVWSEVLIAATLATAQSTARSTALARLKFCRNEACGSAFYDRSKNSSGVWHDVHTCGNAANLRASRARRSDRGAR
jgi:predicted RNA-binding Zn ribbon-like protein